MPFDQPVDSLPLTTPGKLPRISHVLVAGVCCIILAAFLTAPMARYGFALCGAILIFVAGFLRIDEVLAKKADARLLATARHMVMHDPGVGFVTDGAGFVRFANTGAEARFGKTQGRSLAQVFELMLANPANVLAQIMTQASDTGGKTEDIVTRGGHFRLRLVIMREDCQLWWLDDLSQLRGTDAPQQAANGFPVLSVDEKGNVQQMNAACRDLLGGPVHTLDEVFDELPLRSGQVHTLRGAANATPLMVALMERAGGKRDVFLLPGVAAPPLPRQIWAGWDAIEDLPVPLLKIAQDGTLLGSNRQSRQLLNISDGGVRHIADVLRDPGRPITDWLTEVLAGHAGNVSQFLNGRGQKQDTFVQVTLNTAGGADDPHLIAVLNDVTELKTLEAQFVQSQKMQAIGQLAGGVAHDFNNLLTAISGHCELLLCNHDEHDQDYGDLIQIHQNTNRAASLVGQLLAFSRKQNLQLETIDLRDTLSELTHLLNRLVGEKVSLTLDHDPELASIRADKRQLEQVLLNLVVNARDAMPGGGEIRVVTKNTILDKALRRDRVTVPPGSYVMLKVIDQGVGIPADKLHKIFEPFYTTKRTGEGTGLGLSTAYGIVKQTGGYIFVDTALGEGTTFSIFFPFHVAVATSAKPQQKLSNPPIKTAAEGVVLLVEDEAPVRAFATRALRLRGYTVLEADCAEAALDMLENEELHVDLFVTDVIMPGLDGPSWVRQALRKRPHTKVVFVSGYPEDAFGDGEPEVLGAAFLPKPFSLSDLTDMVQEQLHQTRALEPG